MLEKIMEWDRDLLVTLNSYHVPWLDPVMYITSQTAFWLPLYLFLLFLIIRNYKKEAWMPLLGIALAILLADNITAAVMKPYFERLRPSREPALFGIVHLVTDLQGEIYTGGKYGFASSHAANTFATALYFTLLFGKRYRWMFVLFFWAAGMTYTRIYLGVHYPGDIIVGAVVGLLSGLAGYKLYGWLMWRQQRTGASRSEV
jgi:undecaprenyl-diphosphatase